MSAKADSVSGLSAGNGQARNPGFCASVVQPARPPGRLPDPTALSARRMVIARFREDPRSTAWPISLRLRLSKGDPARLMRIARDGLAEHRVARRADAMPLLDRGRIAEHKPARTRGSAFTRLMATTA